MSTRQPGKKQAKRVRGAHPSTNGKAKDSCHTNGNGDGVYDTMPIVTAAKLKARRMEYLWDRRLAVGVATLLTGETGSGKSTLATAIAAAVTNGKSLPGGPKLDAGHVVWLAAEEHPGNTIKPRLLTADADMKKVHFPGWDEDGILRRRPRLTSGVQELRDAVVSVRGRLLIIDPIGSFLDAEMGEDNGHTAREVMQSLTDLCTAAGCAALVVKHPRKGTAGNPLDQVSGSKEWVNQPRASLVIGKHPHAEGHKVVAPLKCSLGPKPASWDCTIDFEEGVSVLRFLRECPLSADDVFQGEGDATERSLLEEAKELLRDRLDAGEQPAKDVISNAEQAGISLKTLQRAKRILGVTSHPKGPNEKRFHVWKRPSAGWPK